MRMRIAFILFLGSGVLAACGHGGTQECERDCTGKQCGDDGCGGSCGTCETGFTCQDGVCQAGEDCRQTGCTGSYYCDLNTGVCVPGCDMDSQCGTNEICDVGTHMCTCRGGFQLCGGECVDLTSDQRHCGSCGQACPSGQICRDSSCQLMGDCRREGCPNGYYCNLNTGECLPGCALDSQCDPSEYCDTSTHECVCPNGTHHCQGVCVSDSDPAHCGQSCSPCPSDPNGTATCDGTSCGIDCINGYELCSGACAQCPTDGVTGVGCSGGLCVATSCASDYELCQGACAPCPTTGVADTVCDGADCVPASCQGGYRLCQGSCAPCPTTGVAETACDGAACVPVACQSDYRLCQGACAPCPTAHVSEVECDGGDCVAISCDSGYFPCATGCCAWSVEVVHEWESDTHGTFPAIAVDSGDRPHVTYANSTDQEARYTTRANGAWASPVDIGVSTVNSAKRTAIAIHNNDVHVMYHEDYKVGYRLKGSGSADFAYPHFFFESEASVSNSYVTLAVKDDGYPWACYKYDNWSYSFLYCNQCTSTGWERETVITSDVSNTTWGRLSVGLDASQAPHLLFEPGLDAPNLSVRQSVDTWARDTTVPQCKNPAMVLDVSGRPHVCGGARSSDALVYSFFDGNGWVSEEIPTEAGGHHFCGIAIDGDGRVHVAYAVDGGSLKYAVQGSTSWNISAVDTSGDEAYYLAMVLDSQGRPHIAYYDMTNGRLKYALGTSRPRLP